MGHGWRGNEKYKMNCEAGEVKCSVNCPDHCEDVAVYEIDDDSR
jgi:hypothetical protein